MGKLKLKKKRIFVAVLVVALFITAIIMATSFKKSADHKKTYEYKLGEVGYSEEQIKILQDKMTDKQLDQVLALGLYDSIPKLIVEKYYMHKNLEKYLAYQAENPETPFTDIVAIINVGADKEWYTNTKSVDLSKGNLMLINKFNQLDETYEPDSLVEVRNWYRNMDNVYLNEDVYLKFISMYDAAMAEDQSLRFHITSAYRAYEYQNTLYVNNKSYDSNTVDMFYMRAGYSEHQSGLAIDILTHGTNKQTFKDSSAYEWLSKNAYKYGFIQRYPDGKDYITGITDEPWHYRYVGEEVATYIQENKITYDEYYAYYIDK